MKYIRLGSTDLCVSRIGVGGMSFGAVTPDSPKWTLDREQTKEMIAHAYDLGVNFIDTANQYAGGTSEAYIGQALKDLGIPRDKVILASKVYFNEGHLSREAILREIDGTLERLQTDYLDLYQIHRFDYGTPMEETLETLDSLVRSGKVRALGASAMYAFQLHNMMVLCEKNGWTGFSTMQNHYNLLYREDEREMIPVCRQYGISLIPYSPLAGGHLSRREWDSASVRSRTDAIVKRRYDKSREDDMPVITRVAEVADRYGVSMSRVAIAWLLHKGAAAPVTGATKMSHFDDAVQAVDLVLSREDIEYMEELYVPHAIKGALPVPAE
ncbi:MAG: aldo/keto reductase [Solobacterium sp.]|nr:aldo/keto reductase [Solobacterium sp.]